MNAMAAATTISSNSDGLAHDAGSKLDERIESKSLKERYSLLKRTLKEVILENEILKEELRRTQSRFMQAAKERTYLLEKLLARCDPADLDSSDEESSAPPRLSSESSQYSRLSSTAPAVVGGTAPPSRVISSYPPSSASSHSKLEAAAAAADPNRKRPRSQTPQSSSALQAHRTSVVGGGAQPPQSYKQQRVAVNHQHHRDEPSQHHEFRTNYRSGSGAKVIFPSQMHSRDQRDNHYLEDMDDMLPPLTGGRTTTTLPYSNAYSTGYM